MAYKAPYDLSPCYLSALLYYWVNSPCKKWLVVMGVVRSLRGRELSKKKRGGEGKGSRKEFGEKKWAWEGTVRRLDEPANMGPPNAGRKLSPDRALSLRAYKAVHPVFNFPFMPLKFLNLFKWWAIICQWISWHPSQVRRKNISNFQLVIFSPLQHEQAITNVHY